VVQKDHPQSNTVEKVEPKIAFDRAKLSTQLTHVTLQILRLHGFVNV